jgi:hypothetical protein
MNYDQFTGVLRALLPAMLAFAVGKAWIPSAAVGDISAAVLAIAAAVWSFLNNRTTAKAAAVSETPGVKVVVAQNAPEAMKELAADTTVPNVVTAK